ADGEHRGGTRVIGQAAEHGQLHSLGDLAVAEGLVVRVDEQQAQPVVVPDVRQGLGEIASTYTHRGDVGHHGVRHQGDHVCQLHQS
ncbi:hypothetical protein COK67_27680, partial [Bacillus cereus]